MSRTREQGSAQRAVVLRVLPGGAGTDSPLGLDGVARRYAPYIAAIALEILGRDSEVDDVVQDVLVAAHRGLGRLRDPGALKGWLASITVRETRRRLRRGAVRRFLHLGSDGVQEDLADPSATPEQRAELQQAYRLLDRMPADARIVWVLRQVEGEQLERIAEICGCSLSTVQRRLRAAQAFMAAARLP
jgi:RNA polymerase sigma-70 factor (ECF subfamily)